MDINYILRIFYMHMKAELTVAYSEWAFQSATTIRSYRICTNLGQRRAAFGIGELRFQAFLRAQAVILQIRKLH
jgi:hypothetical protein